MGTSTPELSVSVDAALKGIGDIAVANVLGSNIYNLAFILGVVSLLRVIPIQKSLLHRDGFALLAATAVGGIALADLQITRLEGVVLVGLFAGYTAYLLSTNRPEPSAAVGDSDSATLTRAVTERVSFRGRDVAFLIGGLAVVLVSGNFMVAASELARSVGISEWVIGEPSSRPAPQPRSLPSLSSPSSEGASASRSGTSSEATSTTSPGYSALRPSSGHSR